MTLFSIVLQVALGVFSREPGLSAGSLCGYHPQDTVVSIPLPESTFEWWDAGSNAMRILPGQYIIEVGSQRLKITR